MYCPYCTKKFKSLQNFCESCGRGLTCLIEIGNDIALLGSVQSEIRSVVPTISVIHSVVVFCEMLLCF